MKRWKKVKEKGGKDSGEAEIEPGGTCHNDRLV